MRVVLGPTERVGDVVGLVNGDEVAVVVYRAVAVVKMVGVAEAVWGGGMAAAATMSAAETASSPLKSTSGHSAVAPKSALIALVTRTAGVRQSTDVPA